MNFLKKKKLFFDSYEKEFLSMYTLEENKPGSVLMIIYLEHLLPSASSGLPGRRTGRPLTPNLPCSEWGLPS